MGWLSVRGRSTCAWCAVAVAALAAGWNAEAGTPTNTDQVADAQRLVAQALRAEAEGNAAQREKLLAAAIEAQPNYAPARWHSGQVRTGTGWQPLEPLQQAAATDPRRIEYLALREASVDNLAGQRALARWCRRNGLADEAEFHWRTVLSRDRSNEEAMRAMGARWFDGQLLSYAEIKAAKARFRTSRRAAKEFAPQVARWERLLSAGDILSRDRALDEIRSLRNTDALPALEKVTLEQPLNSNARFERSMQIGLVLVDALSKMPNQAATESLLRHAAMSPISDVREAAGAALRKRPPHDYVPKLLGTLVSPIESSFRVATDSDGSVHYWHTLYREGQNANWLIEGRSSLFQHDFGGSTLIVNDDNVVIGEERESDASVAAKKAVAASHSQHQFAARAASIQSGVARINNEVTTANEPTVEVLQQVTGQDLGNDPTAWWNWWDRHNDYASYTEGERPTYEERYVDNQRKYYREPDYLAVTARHSCFAPGTPVWTKTGLRAIETIEIGDFVLAQDASTGELAYKPVMGRTIRPNRKTVDLNVGNEVLRATPGHPMWVSGTGWKMATELQPGDVLHGAQRPALVDRVEVAETVDVHNLIVADWHDYFVGECGVLVHDNSPRQPTTATVPGLSAAPMD